MMNDIMLGINDDYACININGLTFYYGYEDTDGEDWLFTVSNKKNTVFAATVAELEKHTGEVLGDWPNPENVLLTGMASFFSCFSRDFPLEEWSEIHEDRLADEDEKVRALKC